MLSVFATLLLLVYGSVISALDQQLIDAIVEKHNQYRSEVCVGPVSWDTSLATWAQTQSDNMASSCSMAHTSSDQRKNIPGWEGQYAGENLAYGMNSQWDSSSVTDLVTMANQGVDGWYGEIADYTISTNQCASGKACGHYTQLVWSTSTTIGCGLSICPDGQSYILSCNYEAGGNFNGEPPYDEAACSATTAAAESTTAAGTTAAEETTGIGTDDCTCTCTTFAETTPLGTTPAETTAAETTPGETTAADTTVAETIPLATTAAGSSPGETIPAETSPGEATAAETTVADSTVAETTPLATTPAESSPGETTAAETSAGETTAAETSPSETSPGESSLGETSPGETTAAETTAADTTVAETSPSETTPAKTTAAETTAAETTTKGTQNTTTGIQCVDAAQSCSYTKQAVCKSETAYTGSQATSITGKSCRPWSFRKGRIFGSAPVCRSDKFRGGPGCFTYGGGWENCFKDCVVSSCVDDANACAWNGSQICKSYSGTKATTKTGKTCGEWKRGSGDRTCRKGRNGPWCWIERSQRVRGQSPWENCYEECGVQPSL